MVLGLDFNLTFIYISQGLQLLFCPQAWFSTVAPVALSSPNTNIVGWDFVTHHLRDGVSNSVIRVKLERRYVDLGSVMIRASSFFPLKKKKKGYVDPASNYFHR